MKELLKKYLNSVCSPKEFDNVTRWLASENNEMMVYSLLKPHWTHLMHQEANQPVNYTLWEKIKLIINEKEKAAALRRLKIYTLSFRVAAVLVVGLLLSNLFFMQKSTEPVAYLQTQTFSVPHGARTNFTLPDGSEVWLNSNSELSYTSGFTKERIITLEGEAYFNVESCKLPFIVNTALGRIEVTGTAFNVLALNNDQQFETTVEEGSVVVSAEGVLQKARLTPGTQARLVDGQWIAEMVETELYTSWKEGKIIFRGAYLPEVASRLERWYNVTIELADDPRLAKIHYTGTLEMESFSEVLELLKVTAPINYTYNEKTRVIRITHR